MAKATRIIRPEDLRGQRLRRRQVPVSGKLFGRTRANTSNVDANVPGDREQVRQRFPRIAIPLCGPHEPKEHLLRGIPGLVRAFGVPTAVSKHVIVVFLDKGSNFCGIQPALRMRHTHHLLSP